MKTKILKVLMVSAIVIKAVYADTQVMGIDKFNDSQKTLEQYVKNNKNHILGNEHLLPIINLRMQKRDKQLENQKIQAENVIQGSSTYTVGSLGNCNFSTLQAAINAAGSGDVIKVMNITFNNNNAVINVSNKSLTIIGGYMNCNVVSLTQGRTTLDGAGMFFPDSIVEVTDVNGAAEVTFRHFVFKNGQDDSDYGGGIEISGKVNATNQERVIVNLSDVIIESNTSTNGGGVHITNGKLILDENSVIKANTANSFGGGIHCTDGDVTVKGDSIIGKDTAQAIGNQALIGGGLYLDSCGLFQDTTGDLLSGYTGGYISGNSALLGGGVAFYNNSTATLLGYKAQINLNSANNGAGLYIYSGYFYGFNASVKGNQAVKGGGVYLLNGAFSLRRNNSFPCRGKCTELSENTASDKGAAIYNFNGVASNNITLDGVWVENNTATVDAAVIGSSSSPEGTYSIKNSMILNNSITDSASPDINALFDISGSVDFSMDLSTLSGSQSANPTDSAVFNFSTSGSISLDDSIMGGNSSNFSLALGTSAAFISSNNNYFQFGGSSWNTDPLFLVPGSNYHIRSDSPAIDAGPTGSQLDIDGESRGGLDNPADIGADEANLRVGINGGICNYSSIALAIAAAQSGDTIYIPKGNYIEIIGLIDKDLTLLQSDATCENEQISAISSDLIVDGYNSFNSAGGLVTIAPDTNVIINNMTLQKAKANFGGIIYVDSGASLVLNNTDIKLGFATRYGGGIRSHGDVTLINSKIVSNTATSIDSNDAQSGGGIALSTTGSLLIEGSTTFVSNNAMSNGGAIYAQGSVMLTDSVQIYANSAVLGAGVYITNFAALTLSNASFIGSPDFSNIASQDGGGIYCANAVVTLNNGARITGNDADNGAGIYANSCTISLNDIAKIGGDLANGNNAFTFGGGIYMTNNSSLNMVNSTEISYNSSQSGGGLYLRDNSAVVTINNAHIANNSAVYGGGVYIYAGEVIFNTSLFYGNSASIFGAAVRARFSNTTINNSVFYGNIGTQLFQVGLNDNFTINDSTMVSNSSNNLFEANTDSSIIINLNNSILSGFNALELPVNATVNTSCMFDSTGSIGSSISPLFVDAANNDYHLQSTSGIINRCSSGTISDFDGSPRPVGTGSTPYDAGAFENQTPGVSDLIFINGFN